MAMLSFLVSGLALLLASLGSAALVRPIRPGADVGARSRHADRCDYVGSLLIFWDRHGPPGTQV
jgi:hypothetical protein